MMLDGPRWRALLEARWRARLEELTELSLAYHDAAGPGPPDHLGDGPDPRQAQMSLRQAVAARQKLEDVEEALARLAAGRFGRCEQCDRPIPAGLLTLIPEARYCPRCDTGPGRPRRDAPPGQVPALAGRLPR
jgi:RNA polymerase-binding transcription factor DksA